MLLESSSSLPQRFNGGSSGHEPPLLGHVLWRNHWTITLAVAGCLVVTAIYLLFATRVYSAQSRLYIQQNGPHVSSDLQTPTAQSDNYLYTQAQAIQSSPVLRYALDQVKYRQLKTFAKLSGDPVDWLLQGGVLRVEVGKKDDTILISMDSPYPDEATALVKAVVDGYLSRLASHRHITGEEMVRILSEERDQLEKKREAGIAALVQFKTLNGAISFRDDKGNTVVDRLSALSASLTTAELATLDIQARLTATRNMLSDPEQISAYVESQQMKGRDFGDKEFDDLRSDLERLQLTLQNDLEVLGQRNVRARAVQSSINLLKTKIAEKEKTITEAQVAQLSMDLQAAEDRETQIRASLEEQRKTALALNPKAAEYARLEGDVDRMQKQCDGLDARIQEVSVNNVKAGAMDVEVLDPARADEKPIRPKKLFALAVAMLAGLVLGTGIVMVQEWKNKLLRTPDEVVGSLDVPTIGIVPRMPVRLSSVDRGQIVHRDSMSEVAEAYRGIRTTIGFTAPPGSKTFLVTSPTSGEGKSTCSSNLAIAFAQGGHRTLLIDADLRRPVQGKMFNVENGVGLSDVMTGGAKLREAICPTAINDLFVLPCGTIPGRPAEMLQSKRFVEVMETLSATFDRVVIDSPPVIAVTDARILAASADATILVLRMNRSSQKLGSVALDALRKVKANVLGAIANEAETSDGYGYYGQRQTRVSSREVLLRRLGSAIGYEIANQSRNGNGHRLGNGNGHGHSTDAEIVVRLPDDILALNEPEAPADARWKMHDHHGAS